MSRTDEGRERRMSRAVRRGREHLLSLQEEDGHWCGELEADSVLESEYIMLLHFLGRADSPDARRAAEEVRRRQRDEGGWSIFPSGADDVSASVKAYLALKLMGDAPDAPHMRRARRVIRSLGGVEATNTYTQIYLALMGEYEWERCPAVPPEMVLLPRWFYFNLYEISAWSRGIFVPLSILWAEKPVRPVPDHASIPELRVGTRPARDLGETPYERGWRSFFYAVDQGLKAVESFGITPFRQRALEVAERWIRERQADTDGLGAIFPAILNTVMALVTRGYSPEHPSVAGELEALEKMIIREEETLRIQPALSPVWDTAQAMVALREAGLPVDHPALDRATEWLLDREVRRPGDWREKGVRAEPSGWYFEYANPFYPDCDDTAEVLQALDRVDPDDPELVSRLEAARRRGLEWLMAMQNDDGGWAAFDRGCHDKEILTCVPFADHNAMLDPSCADITGRVLSVLGGQGRDAGEPEVRAAVRYLRSEQLADGSWYGRWGCNYIYGTAFALCGLAAVGEDMSHRRYRRSVGWLESVQNEDGGWGETLRTYSDPDRKGEGPSTAAQTAWALLALEAAGAAQSEAARRGVAYLIRTQEEDGGWDDPWWTGTGFPQVFYLRYHYYDDYFPLLALARYAGTGTREERDDEHSDAVTALRVRRVESEALTKESG